MSPMKSDVSTAPSKYSHAHIAATNMGRATAVYPIRSKINSTISFESFTSTSLLNRYAAGRSGARHRLSTVTPYTSASEYAESIAGTHSPASHFCKAPWLQPTS